MGERVGQIARVPEVKQSNSNSRVRRTKRLQSMDTPVDRILFLQRTVGNRVVSRLMKPGALQAKLRIGQPGDKYEQEADQVADVVMRMLEPGVQRQEEPEEEEEMLQAKPLVDQIASVVQRQVEEDEEEEEILQTKESSKQSPAVSSNLETNIQSLKTEGTPLPKLTRAFFEPRFGHDFSKVKLHTNTRAAELARTEITSLMQRQESLGEEKDEELIQTKIARDVTPEVTPAISSSIQSLQGGGQPLSGSERSFFEPRFGADFSIARVHNDTRAANAARSINARAFTIGPNIVFARGQYDPQTIDGKRLIAHELVHVIQQRTHQVQTIMRTCNCDAIPNGRDPSPDERLFLEMPQFGSLRYGNYCITGPSDASYNCFALTINARTHVQNEIDTDRDRSISSSEANRFYRFHGFSHISSGPLNADLVLYGPNQDDIKHAAIGIPQICDGIGMFESKLGDLWKIAHFPEQLQGSMYGRMQIYYRRQRMTPAEKLAPIRLPTPTFTM